jgi:hypothetical protein
MKRVLCLGVLCAALAACATSNLELLQPGSVTIEQMRMKEKPTAEWKNADGSITLEYSNRPVSAKNVMLDFDGKGALREANSVVTLENMARLKIAMSRAEVQRIVGSPSRVLKDSYTGGDLWQLPLEVNVGVAQPVIQIYWHPRVDAVVKISEGVRFE